MSNEAQALWYVVHTYSGYENKVAENIKRMVESRNLGDLIFETKIPTEIVVDTQEEARRLFSILPKTTGKRFPKTIILTTKTRTMSPEKQRNAEKRPKRKSRRSIRCSRAMFS